MKEQSLPERLDFMVSMLRELSRNEDPVGSINGYAEAMRQLYTDRGLISVSLRGGGPGQYRVMRLLHQDSLDDPRLEAIPFAGPDAPYREGGFIADVVREARAQVIRDLDVPRDPVLGEQLAPYRLLVACPVFDSGDLKNWVFFLHANPEAFTDRDIETWVLQANMMASISNTKRMAREVVEANAYVQQQVNEIADIQQRQLPARFPRIPGLDGAAMYATYDRAGGDYYDAFPLATLEGAPPGERRWLIVMADASGHGPSAAVLVSVLSALLHSHPGPLDLPCRMLTYLNRHLLRRPLYNAFVTALLLIYDPETRTVQFASAGHPMPLLRRACGSVEELPRAGGIPLAVMPDAVYTTAMLRLEAGQGLLLYTDGITEARNARREMFETWRLQDALGVCGQSARDTLDAVVAQLRAHEGGQRQQDDQTLLVLRATELDNDRDGNHATGSASR